MATIVTPALLNALFIGFRKEYEDAFAGTPSHYERISTVVPSTTESQLYSWMGQFPAFREWVGDRVVKSMQVHGYQIINKNWESTVGVEKPKIEDDQAGIYSPLMRMMGEAAKVHPDELIFPLLKAGNANVCYDGQYFFDTDHPVYPNADGTGVAASVSNWQTGAGPLWVLMCTKRALKPMVFQRRKAPVFTAMNRMDDEAVFTANVYRYGVDSRDNAGYGLWQLAYGSKAALTYDNLWTAYQAMCAFKADGGRPLNIMPDLLVVPTSLSKAAHEAVERERLTDGASNTLHRKFEVLETAWLD